jgi:hypothetical protein
MITDASTPANETGGSLFSQVIHSRRWKRGLVVAVLAGMAVGDLNLAAEAHQWPAGGLV